MPVQEPGIASELIKLGPAAGAVFVVWLFISYLRFRDNHYAEALKELKQAVDKLADKINLP